MKTILCGEAASDSGRVGFSEAWPLEICISVVKAAKVSSHALTILPILHELPYALPHRQ